MEKGFGIIVVTVGVAVAYGAFGVVIWNVSTWFWNVGVFLIQGYPDQVEVAAWLAILAVAFAWRERRHYYII